MNQKEDCGSDLNSAIAWKYCKAEFIPSIPFN